MALSHANRVRTVRFGMLGTSSPTMFPPNPAAAGVIITAFAKELARRYQILINIIKDMTMLEPFRRSQVINRSA